MKDYELYRSASEFLDSTLNRIVDLESLMLDFKQRCKLVRKRDRQNKLKNFGRVPSDFTYVDQI